MAKDMSDPKDTVQRLRPFPSRELDKVVVRLPDGMRDKLKAEADENGRSVNAEIVARLQDTFTIDKHMRERSKQLGEETTKPVSKTKRTTDEEILKEIQALREDFNRLNTKTFVEMMAKVGNHLAEKQDSDKD